MVLFSLQTFEGLTTNMGRKKLHTPLVLFLGTYLDRGMIPRSIVPCDPGSVPYCWSQNYFMTSEINQYFTPFIWPLSCDVIFMGNLNCDNLKALILTMVINW